MHSKSTLRQVGGYRSLNFCLRSWQGVGFEFGLKVQGIGSARWLGSGFSLGSRERGDIVRVQVQGP